MFDSDPLEHFQDRAEAIVTFDALWNVGQHRWVAVFHGFSGTGKSTLIEWLQEKRCKANNIPYSSVDFSTLHEYKELLDNLLRQNSLHSHLPEAAYQQYIEKRDAILKDRDHYFDFISINQDQVGGYNNIQEINLNLLETKELAESHARERLTNAWLDCLREMKSSKVAFFLDAFENYKDDVDLLWTTLERAQKELPILRVIIGSRQPTIALKHRVLEQRLNSFTLEHSDALLSSLGVTDIGFREAVYKRLANGHPLVTRFAADVWLQAQSIGRPLNANEVPKVGKLEEAIRWVQDEILSRLQEPLKAAVRWAALMRGFNLEILNELLNFNLSEEQFRQLTLFSFIEFDINSASWKCHDLLRGVQNDYLYIEQPQAFINFHRKAGHYFGVNGKNLEHIYHRFFYEVDPAFELWINSVVSQQSKFDFAQSEQLFEIIENSEFPLSDLQSAAFLHVRGLHYLYLSEYRSARNFFRDSKKLYEISHHSLGIANLTESLGDIELAKNNYDAAKTYYKEAGEIFSSLGDSSGIGRIYSFLGQIELMTGNLKEAKTNYDLAAPLIDKTQKPNDHANLLISYGNLNLLMNNIEIAQKQYKEAYELYANAENRRGQATALSQLAQINAKAGELESAKRNLNTAIKFFDETSDVDGAAQAYLTLGDICLHNKDYSGGTEGLEQQLNEANYCYAVAIELFQSIGDKRGEANALSSLGYLLTSNGQFGEAKKYLLLSLSIQGDAVSPVDKANILIGLVQIEHHLDNLEQAKNHYSEAMAITEKLGIRYTPTAFEWRHNFWSMIFTIEEDLYILSMRVLDWVLKRTKADSEQYISQMSGVLLTSDAETVITKMLDFGPDKRLLKFHLQLLRSCNKLGINKAYSRINRSIWDNTGHKRH